MILSRCTTYRLYGRQCTARIRTTHTMPSDGPVRLLLSLLAFMMCVGVSLAGDEQATHTAGGRAPLLLPLATLMMLAGITALFFVDDDHHC